MAFAWCLCAQCSAQHIPCLRASRANIPRHCRPDRSSFLPMPACYFAIMDASAESRRHMFTVSAFFTSCRLMLPCLRANARSNSNGQPENAVVKCSVVSQTPTTIKMCHFMSVSSQSGGAGSVIPWPPLFFFFGARVERSAERKSYVYARGSAHAALPLWCPKQERRCHHIIHPSIVTTAHYAENRRRRERVERRAVPFMRAKISALSSGHCRTPRGCCLYAAARGGARRMITQSARAMRIDAAERVVYRRCFTRDIEESRECAMRDARKSGRCGAAECALCYVARRAPRCRKTPRMRTFYARFLPIDATFHFYRLLHMLWRTCLRAAISRRLRRRGAQDYHIHTVARCPCAHAVCGVAALFEAAVRHMRLLKSHTSCTLPGRRSVD